jgi:hypothetical protein
MMDVLLAAKPADLEHSGRFAGYFRRSGSWGVHDVSQAQSSAAAAFEAARLRPINLPERSTIWTQFSSSKQLNDHMIWEALLDR